MKVLVTGARGFLGSALCDELKDHVVAKSGTKECDLLKADQTIDYFSSRSPEIIIHLAANVGGIGKNNRIPGTLAYENMMMGLNVLNAARHLYFSNDGFRKLVIIGTICAYPKFCPVPFKEEDIWNGYPEETNAPYGIAKKAVMVTGQAFQRQYGINIINLLVVNLYGPKDNFDLNDSHVIPAMIRKFHSAKESGAKTVKLWGDGSPSREFLFVRDAASAIKTAMEEYNSPDPINIGSGVEIPIKHLAETISDIVGFDGQIVWDCRGLNGQPRRCLDVSKAEKLFGWKAQTKLIDGLRETYEWYKGVANED